MNKFLVLILLSALTTQSWAEKIILLHTNDHHGSFAPSKEGHFGLAAQSTLIKIIKKQATEENAFVDILSAGDPNTGPAISNLFKAEPDLKAMNAMGFSAMAIGNHEFDNGLEGLLKQQKLADFEFLSANITDPSGKLIFKPYITKQYGDIKVAIVGISTPDTPILSVPKNTEGVLFESPFEKTRDLIKGLRKDHDLIIALSHLGFYPNEEHGKNFPGDITLAKKIPEIDVIIGGHTHTELTEPYKQGKTLIVQAKEGGQFLGKLELDVDKGAVKLLNYELMPVKGYAPDPEIEKIFKPYLAKAEKKFSAKVGKTVSAFVGGRGIIDTSEQPLGNFIAQAQKEAAQTDISIVDSKGIRAGMPKGVLTLKDILNISPFGNTLVRVEVTGKELWSTIQNTHDFFIAQGQQMYFSKGLQIKFSEGKLKELLLDGELIHPTGHRTYKIVMNNYLAYGGGGFTDFRNNSSFFDTGIKDVEALESFLKKKEAYDPAEFWHKTYGPISCNHHFTK